VLQSPARIVVTFVLFIALSGSLIFASPGAAIAASGDVGTPAPNFDLLIFQGGGASQSLNDLSGKVVMLFIVGYS